MSNKETRISSRYEYLLEILPLAMTRLLSGPVTEAGCGPATESLSLLAEAQPFNRSHSDHYKSLDNATAAHPCVSPVLFLAHGGTLAGRASERHELLPDDA